jgi:hypothetical protein
MSLAGAVLLSARTRLTANAFGKASADRERLDRMLLVGISRATRWVYLSTSHGLDIPGQARVTALERAGTLVVQRGELPLFRSHSMPDPEPPADDPLDVLV